LKLLKKRATLRPIRPATPLLASAPGRVFFLAKMRYSKPPLPISDQIDALERRGMVFSDKGEAAHYLSHISYYRLRAYTFPYQNNADPDHPFWHPITFERVLNDYIFDGKLRVIVFDALEKIEVALRTQIIYQYSVAYGSHWYQTPSHFRKIHLFNADIQRLDKELDRSQEEFIKHYKSKYTIPARPLGWLWK